MLRSLKLRIFQSSMPERTHTCLIPCSILQKEIDRAELDSLCFGAKSMLSYSNQLDKNMLPEGTKYHQSQLKWNKLCRVLTHITAKLQFEELQESSLNNNLGLGITSKWPANSHVRSKENSSGFFIHPKEIWPEVQKFNYNFIRGL